MITSSKAPSTILIFLLLLCAACATSGDSLVVIHSRTAVDMELTGYDGLTETSVFKGNMAAGGKQEIETAYHGLALLRFTEGQGYPVFIGNESFTLNIGNPAEPPSFTGSRKNLFFYSLLAGKEPEGQQDDFALLLIRARQLLESSYSIRTVTDLSAKRKEFHEFVCGHYDSLRHSDMVRRLIAQYFMMHEYVDYHTGDAPAQDIKVKFQQEVLNGVGSWLEILRPHIPAHEILNYIVSLYYQRSMVTLASHIVENFRSAAYCPGSEKETWSFPKDLLVAGANRSRERHLGTIKGEKIIAFVSDDCPVSMVAAVRRARQLADRNTDVRLIVMPLQPLSEKHLAMNRMVSNGNMLFVNDEQWRNANLAEKIRLPVFVPLGDDLLLPTPPSMK